MNKAVIVQLTGEEIAEIVFKAVSREGDSIVENELDRVLDSERVYEIKLYRGGL